MRRCAVCVCVLTILFPAAGGGCRRLFRGDAETAPKKRISINFEAIDTDHNGSLSRDEFIASKFARHVGNPSNEFDAADTNNDTAVSRQELGARLALRSMAGG
jgi:hypothetical protein